MTTQAVTMSSREIAEITGKQHKNVLADIRWMMQDLGLTPAEFSANLPRFGDISRTPTDDLAGWRSYRSARP